ncbi:MAG: thioredoxin family protein [Gemmataceae bacterium]
MFRYAIAALVLAGLVAVQPASADIKIGDSAPAYSNLPGVDGKTHSLADLKAKDVLVLVITCNHCPVAVDYEDRLIDFTKKYSSSPDSKVAVVAINVNNLPADRLDKMIERSKEKGFNFSYLYDESQKIAKDLGAKVTPEFYVFDKNRKLVYHGAMDDSRNPTKVSKKYLEAAVDSLLAGKAPEVPQTKAFGCSVKYD